MVSSVIRVQILCGEREGLPHFGIQRIGESGRQNAHDFHRSAVDHERPPDDIGIAPKTSLPESMPQQNHLVLARLRLFC